MRTRNKTTGLVQRQFFANTSPITTTLCGQAPIVGTTAVPSATFTQAFVKERMRDSLGKGLSHSCLHRKHVYNALCAQTSSVIPSSPAGTVFRNDGGYSACASMASLADGHLSWDVSSDTSLPPHWTDVSAPIDEEAVKSRLLDAANQLKADVLLNIVEANQIVPSVRSLVTSLPKMARQWRSIRRVIRTASGGYLAWKFGVSPILSDVMSIHRYLPKLKGSLKRHLDEKASRFSTSAALNFAISPSPYKDGYSMVNGYYIYTADWYGQIIEPGRIKYVLVVKPSSAGHSRAAKLLDFAIGRFASSPASLAWELVPFSFVVDWLIDVSGALRAVDKLVGFKPYEVVSFTRSRSYHLGSIATHGHYSPCNGSALNWFQASAEFKHYERSLVSKQAILPAWRPHFGKNQAAISAALIAQALTGIRAK